MSGKEKNPPNENRNPIILDEEDLKIGIAAIAVFLAIFLFPVTNFILGTVVILFKINNFNPDAEYILYFSEKFRKLAVCLLGAFFYLVFVAIPVRNRAKNAFIRKTLS